MTRWGIVATGVLLLAWPAGAEAATLAYEQQADGRQRLVLAGTATRDVLFVDIDDSGIRVASADPPPGCAAEPGTSTVVCPPGPVAVRAGDGGDDVFVSDARTGALPAEDVVVSGDGGDDRLVDRGGSQAWDGGAGKDRLDASVRDARRPGVLVDLRTGTTAGPAGEADTLRGVEAVTGTPGADRLLGGDGADELAGAGGDDVLEGRAGPDRLAGDGEGQPDGADRLLGGPGGDSLEPDGGLDDAAGGTGDDLIDLTDQTTRESDKGEDFEAFELDVPDERPSCGSGRDVVLGVDDGDVVPRDCERAAPGAHDPYDEDGLPTFDRPRLAGRTVVLRAADLSSSSWRIVVDGPGRARSAPVRFSSDPVVLRLRLRRPLLGSRLTLAVRHGVEGNPSRGAVTFALR